MAIHCTQRGLSKKLRVVLNLVHKLSCLRSVGKTAILCNIKYVNLSILVVIIIVVSAPVAAE